MAVSLRSVARRLCVARVSRPSVPLSRPARTAFAARFRPLSVNSQVRAFTSTSYLRQEAEAKPEAKQANGNGSLEEKVKQLETQLAEKEKQLKDYQDRYVRAMAEIENVRRIGREDVSKATKYGVQSFAKSLLTVADEMQLAIQNFPVKGDDIEKDATAKAILEGLKMTEKTLLKVLEQNGVTKMSTLGAKFDTNCHDAIFQVDDQTKEPGTVAQVLKEGFMMKDRCLRPATVGVVKKRAA